MSPEQLPPALVVSGFTMGLALTRALGRRGVPVVVLHYDARDMAHRSRYAAATMRVPHPEHDESGFLDAVVGLAPRWGGGVLFPASDEALVSLSRNHEALSRHFRVACTPWAITEQLIDKWLTFKAARQAGVAVPETELPQSDDDVRAYAARARMPCLVKPCESHRFYEVFGTKMVRVESERQMLAAYRDAAAAGLRVMLQELIPGDDRQVANYNAYAVAGEVVVEFTADHIRAAPPLIGSPRVCLSRVIPELIQPGRRLLHTIGFAGYACTEFKRDERDGIFKLMEINGRHNLSTSLAIACGMDFPWLHYRHLAFGEVPRAREYQVGVYWTDLVRDIGYTARFFRREGQSIADYVRPYLHRRVDAIVDLRDIRPFATRCAYLARMGARTLGGWVRRGLAGNDARTPH